jgi:23S rRNA pseudouridine1911/1915/1917 synthase
VARSLVAHTALVRLIAARDVSREYLALVHGRVGAAPFSVEAPIGRDPKSRVRMAVAAAGKPARTDVRLVGVREIEGAGAVSAVACKLHTGRTHQIRVHLSHRGHPLLGDVLYGGRPVLDMERQALHAHRLAFEHPVTREALSFQAGPPPDFAQAWAQVAIQ